MTVKEKKFNKFKDKERRKEKNMRELAFIARNNKGAVKVRKTKLVIELANGYEVIRIFDPATNQYLKGKRFLEEKRKAQKRIETANNKKYKLNG